MSVHPHAGGEHSVVTRYLSDAGGSSPRGWGTLPDCCSGPGGLRFIPTRVGNTGCRDAACKDPTVHPHAGGEHKLMLARWVYSSGSSPRGWGTPVRSRELSHDRRFIPTRVGNTGWRRPFQAVNAVHPHAGGEHGRSPARASSWVGSSPRGWGTRLPFGGGPLRCRFIPTRVGNTWGGDGRHHGKTVHPHAGGEHVSRFSAWYLSVGSSPRGWGTRHAHAAHRARHRFIPTRVGNTCLARPTLRGMTVHPHAGGEHAAAWVDARRDAGSSPRGWGTPGHGLGDVLQQRFIPTRVGNTPAEAGASGEGSVHPHAGGEHLKTATAAMRDAGSSPRGWGTPLIHGAALSLPRFIPTRVGNTAMAGHGDRRWPVHPHAGGEHTRVGLHSRCSAGSSPRGWGTPGMTFAPLTDDRFIPTRVGNTPWCFRWSRSRSVHPHAGGEHTDGWLVNSPRRGSSPRGWGTRPNTSRSRAPRRFIPTRVGNTWRPRRNVRPLPVHPHAGGEHPTWRLMKPIHIGSSPRGWGTLEPVGHAVSGRRFIPTRVGNTVSSVRALLSPTVHPHAGGEHPSARILATSSAGSSPRGWGTPDLLRLGPDHGRFIPTRVGNTSTATMMSARVFGSSPRGWGTH